MIDLRAMTGGVIPSRQLSFGPPPVCLPPDMKAEYRCDRAYYGIANPSTAQRGDSCGAKATENTGEAMLRMPEAMGGMPQVMLFKRIEKILGHLRWQVDGERLYEDARKAWYGGKMDGGLTMEQIGLIPLLTGLFGDEVEIIDVQPNVDARREALEHGPFVMGVATSEAWGDPDPKSGYIRAESPNPRAGHAICEMGMHSQGSLFETHLGSWGRKWGRYGYGMMNSEYITYCQIDVGKQWRVPREWWKNAAIWDYIIADNEEAA